MKERKIPIAGPWVTEKEINYTAQAASDGWYDNATKWNTKFENKFSDYINSNYSITVPHCTAAIHLALLALGIKEGDEVIVPDVTWIASAAPITYIGAKTIFADINIETWCIDEKSLKSLITSKTKAIITVDLYGSMPNYDEIVKIANSHNIPIIEDAAEAFGSKINNIMAGNFGKIGVFSFHGSKTLTTGEGGMLVTNDESIRDKVLFLRDHGRKPGDFLFQNAEIAFKYRMSPLQAAFGVGQIERAEELVSKKRLIFKWYKERLSENNLIKMNYESPNMRNSYWMTTIIYSDDLRLRKEDLISKLLIHGIQTRPFFNQLSKIPAYANNNEAKNARYLNKNAALICHRGINLPSALCLKEDDIDFVCNKLEKILKNSF